MIHVLGNGMRLNNIAKCIFVILFSIMVLGAKGCEVAAKSDVTEYIPEILEIAPDIEVDINKFDIKRYGNMILLTTYDNLTFHEAIDKLKNETLMNIPVHISMPFYGERIGSEGEFKTEHTVDEIIAFTGEELRPYVGIIHIRDGWWTANEFDAVSLFTNDRFYTYGNVAVTEYVYANATVYKLNGWSSRHGIRSDFDKTESRGGYVQGDGSIPEDIISVYNE
ncbi:MAG: hypothetical protein Pg6C_05650 [Treponemataceae bacterium]|nr:MAG: hypothetical protein Pg6C_05650 [Treponemataceae bacterium]